jgi:hypothetical protein
MLRLHIGLKMIGNERKKAPPLSLPNYFDGIENDTILAETEIASIFR